MKKVIKIVVIILILYLSISSVYVLFHINWGSKPQIVGMGFSDVNNRLRLFMGLPKTYTTYEGVSPIFLIEVTIKIILVGILIKYLRRK